MSDFADDTLESADVGEVPEDGYAYLFPVSTLGTD